MKILMAYVAGGILLATSWMAAAKEPALQYQFIVGQTNAYAVEISVRGETGTDVTRGNILLVTEEVNSNFVKILYWLRPSAPAQQYSMRQAGGRFRRESYRTLSGDFYMPNGCEIILNQQGQELRDAGDRVLSAPLGKLVQSIFEPLPVNGREKETTANVVIMDEPLWLGPSENFQNSSMNRPYFYSGQSENPPGVLRVTQKSLVKFNKAGADNRLAWHKHGEFESWLKPGGTPEFSATTESDFTFDRSMGALTYIDTEASVDSQTETSSRKARVSFKARRLTEGELAAALKPLPEPADEPVFQKPLTEVDLGKVMQDLKSDDLEKQRIAISRLNNFKMEHPSDELIDAVAALATNGDTSMRWGVAGFLAAHATTNQVGVLLKLLQAGDWGSRQNVVKALARLHDPAAIQPLVDVLAINPNMAQMDLNNALAQFGSTAEPAVLTLFKERNRDTRQQACVILQRIGTTNSLPALQEQVGDPDQSLSQAATEAIRAIKLRQ